MMAEAVETALIKQSYSDIGAYLESLRGWSLDVSPLRGEAVGVDLALLQGAGIVFRRFSHRVSAVHRGVNQNSGLTLVYYPADSGPLVVNHRACREDVVVLHPPGGEINLISPNQFSGYSLTLSDDLLDGVTAADRLRSSESSFYRGNSGAQQRLKAALLRLAKLLDWFHVREEKVVGLQAFLEDICLQEVIPALHAVTAEGNPLPSEPVEARALSTLLDLVMDNLDTPLSLSEMAQAAGCSGRHVQSLFRRFIGVSPMGFAKVMRLHAARRCLSASPAVCNSVTEVALRYRFEHLGRFSQEYKRHFGETPLQTLKRRDETPDTLPV